MCLHEESLHCTLADFVTYSIAIILNYHTFQIDIARIVMLDTARNKQHIMC